MQGRSRSGEQLAAALHVEAVVAVAAVERAPTDGDQPRSAQLPQVVGDERLLLVERADQFPNAAVAPRKLAQEAPTQRMARRAEDKGRRLL
jgi:hypothetical protein